MRALASAIFLAGVLAVCPTLGWAQAGWYVTPSFSLTEEFDDNLFAESSGQRSDFITRFSPGLRVGYRSTPFTLEGSVSLDAEVYANNPELSDEATRNRAGLDLKYLPTPLLTLGLGTSYTETETPTELVPETGIELGRGRATQFGFVPSVSYRFTPLTSGDASYSYTESRPSGGITNVTHQTNLMLSRQLTPVDTGTLGYRLNRFDSEGSDSTTSHALTAGWTRQVTEVTNLTLRGGLRISEGAVDPEASLSLAHQFKLAKVSVTYAQSEASVVGQAGAVKTESLSGSVGFEPLKLLEVSLSPSVRKSSTDEDSSSTDTTVYGLNASASYRITQWMSTRATYRFSFQEGGREEIVHNIFSISLDLTYPTRVD